MALFSKFHRVDLNSYISTILDSKYENNILQDPFRSVLPVIRPVSVFSLSLTHRHMNFVEICKVYFILCMILFMASSLGLPHAVSDEENLCIFNKLAS